MEYERWERRNLDCMGCYSGPDLREFGFPFEQGEYVPPSDRHWSQSEYKWAIAARKLSRNLQGLAVA